MPRLTHELRAGCSVSVVADPASLRHSGKDRSVPLPEARTPRLGEAEPPMQPSHIAKRPVLEERAEPSTGDAFLPTCPTRTGRQRTFLTS